MAYEGGGGAPLSPYRQGHRASGNVVDIGSMVRRTRSLVRP